MRIAVAAEATRLRVASRQDVQCPAADEFGAGQADFFGLVAAAGLLACPGAERDVSVFVTNESAIRDRTARHVAGQIFQHLVGSGVRRRGSLDVSHPLHIFQRLQPVFKRGGIPQRQPFPVELQFASGLQSS